MLGASSSSRWLNCPPSACIEWKMPDVSSDFAQEGTLAHAHAAALLKTILGIEHPEEDREIAELAPRFASGEMGEYVDGYVNFVMNRFREAGDNAELMIEQRLDYSDWVPEGFGTGDAVIVTNGTLDIIDLKYGKGVIVFADENPQMKLYALGALAVFDCMWDIDEVRMTIYQPRVGNISTWTQDVKSLKEWGENYVKPLAKLAYHGLGNRATGSWCKFCKAKGECGQLAKENMGVGNALRLGVKETLLPEQYSHLLKELPLFSEWIEAIKEKTLAMALGGTELPGYKIVEGRSVRKITDPGALGKRLMEAGWERERIYRPRELRTLTDLEKLTGKKRFAELSEGLVEKPKGKPTLVADTDHRESLSAAADYSGMDLT